MGAIVSTLSVRTAGPASRRPPHVLQNTPPSLFALPQMAQRTSNAADNNAPQLLQNLLLALFGDPQCEQ